MLTTWENRGPSGLAQRCRRRKDAHALNGRVLGIQFERSTAICGRRPLSPTFIASLSLATPVPLRPSSIIVLLTASSGYISDPLTCSCPEVGMIMDLEAHAGELASKLSSLRQFKPAAEELLLKLRRPGNVSGMQSRKVGSRLVCSRR